MGQVNREDIRQRRLSLVVAIWDQDTDTRDDYMAGVREREVLGTIISTVLLL